METMVIYCPRCGSALVIEVPGFKKTTKVACMWNKQKLEERGQGTCNMVFECWIEGYDIVIRVPRFLKILEKERQEAERRHRRGIELSWMEP